MLYLLSFMGACLETPDWAEHLPSCVAKRRGRKEKGKALHATLPVRWDFQRHRLVKMQKWCVYPRFVV